MPVLRKRASRLQQDLVSPSQTVKIYSLRPELSDVGSVQFTIYIKDLPLLDLLEKAPDPKYRCLHPPSRRGPWPAAGGQRPAISSTRVRRPAISSTRVRRPAITKNLLQDTSLIRVRV
jgi:hypothetical protein